MSKKILVLPYRLWKLMLRRALWKKKDVKVAYWSRIDQAVSIGRGTRINAASHIGPCCIGKYCSIGGRLVVRSSNHDMRYANMQDYLQYTKIASKVKVVGKSQTEVRIGHTCWIGDSVIILPNVDVGEGAVVGAGSVVTKSIPPYAVAVGNPAKVIRYRFSGDIIEHLMKIKWWDWSDEKIKRNKAFFESDLTACTLNDLKNMIHD